MSFDYKPIGYGATVYSGFAFKSSDLTNGGIPVIKIGNIQNKTVDYSSSQFFLEENITEKHKKFLLEDKDVLIAMTGQGSVGRVGRIRLPTSKKILLNQRVGKFVTDDTILNKDYLYYVISSLPYEEMFFNAGSGSGQPNLSPNTILSLEIPYPTIPEQETIAATLSCFDDKIELNNRIITNLEAQAQATFKSWFVDFEPFLDGEFEASELGLIPKGWRVGVLSDIAEITMGQSPSGESFNENEIGTVFYQGRAEFGFRFPTRRLFTTAPSRMAQAGDVLLSVRAPVGDINVATEECCIGRGLSAIHSLNEWQSFLLYLMKQLHDILNKYNGEGTVFGSINRKDLNQLAVIVPLLGVMQRFEYLVGSFDNEILNLHKENMLLAKARDTLLPKLMSGEIEVPVEG